MKNVKENISKRDEVNRKGKYCLVGGRYRCAIYPHVNTSPHSLKRNLWVILVL
jgi:hypothetical protein